MTFMNCFTQLNMDNSSGFYDTSTPQVSFTNMWNSMPLFNFDTSFKFPSFDFSSLNIFNWNNSFDWNSDISWSNSMSFGDTFTRSTKSSSIGTNHSTLKLDGYNASAGRKLADIAMNRRQADRWSSIKGTGKCATYTKKAIEAAGMGSYVSGHGYQMTDILSKNKNFKQISASGVDVSKLPAGCVLVYGKGVSRYSKEYGHTEITTGDGRGVSQAITYHVRKPSAIFIPV